MAYRKKGYDTAMLQDFIAQLKAEMQLHRLLLDGHVDLDFVETVAPGLKPARKWGAVLLPLERLEQGTMPAPEYKVALALHKEHQREKLDLLANTLKLLEATLEEIFDGLEKQAGEPELQVTSLDADAFTRISREVAEAG